MAVRIRLSRLPGGYAVARLDPASPIPRWADGAGFVSIGRTDDELSVICLADRIPADVKHDGGWVCLKMLGPFEFNEIGIALAVMRPLSENGISMLLVSTFDTDYVLVKAADLDRAKSLLTAAGHEFVGDG